MLRALLAWLTAVACLATAGVAAAVPTRAIKHLFDLAAVGASPLSLPTDVAVEPNGRIVVVDSGNDRLVAFEPDGRQAFTVGSKGSGQGQFDGPVGIAAGRNGELFVADRGNRRIQVFSADGQFRSSFPIRSDGSPVAPVDVAVSADGQHLFVTGNTNHKVLMFTAAGEFVREWGGEGVDRGEFRFPASVAVGADGSVYVVDVFNTRVQVFDEQGTLVVTVGGWGVLPGQLFRPKGVAVDARARVLVSDSYTNVVQVFDDETRFLHVLGNEGTPQRFDAPTGLALGPDNRLYVAETLGNKVSVYVLGD